MNNFTTQNQESQEKYCVYMHTCTISGKSYIGQTIRGWGCRWAVHLSDSKHGSQCHLHRAIRLYGEECWTHDILYVSFERDSEHLGEIEIILIAEYNTLTDGYNMTAGGAGLKKSEGISEETREKLRVAKGGKNHPLFGTIGRRGPKHHMWGKTHRPESIELLTKSMREAGLPKNNTSGTRGVNWHTQRNKWRSEIKINGSAKHLGLFINKNDAIIARKMAELRYWDQIM